MVAEVDHSLGLVGKGANQLFNADLLELLEDRRDDLVEFFG